MISESKALTAVYINADKSPVKTKKFKDNSGRLKITVCSKVTVDEQIYIYIRTYKKNDFVEHYILTLDNVDYKVLTTCHFSEII
jgi:phage antirepressor YoqD-like protein